jgi:VWFA-related protein
MPFCLLLLTLLLQDGAIFRSDVALVRADAEVRTESGPVSDLRRDSFRVTDNGLEQNVVYFAHDEQPLEVILLFDTSNSMRPVVARVAEAAHIAMGELRLGDRVAIMAFDRTTDLVEDFTGDIGVAERAISGNVLQRKNHCCSPIQAAVGAAARVFLKQHTLNRQQSNRRRAIIAITDDWGTRVRPSALRDLQEADAIVLGVIVRRGRGFGFGPGMFRYRGIRDFAINTGGDMLNTRDAAEGIREMLNRLRTRYSLYYALPPCGPGEIRTIKVELTGEAATGHPGAIVRARTGYFAPR